MRPLGHLAGGYLASRAVLGWLKPARTNRAGLLLAGTLAGLGPDLDTLVHLARSRSLEFGADFDHHRWVSHTFPVYLGPGLGLYWLGRRLKRLRLSQMAMVVTAGAVTHLLQDGIGSGTGLMWAWPFSRRMDGLWTLHVKGGRAWLEVYSNHPVAWVERLIILAAGLLWGYDLVRQRPG